MPVVGADNALFDVVQHGVDDLVHVPHACHEGRCRAPQVVRRELRYFKPVLGRCLSILPVGRTPLFIDHRPFQVAPDGDGEGMGLDGLFLVLVRAGEQIALVFGVSD